jgi:selenocysteine-specific elongation factor
MIARNLILATAGHVDHGKSSLVKALTGIDPDRLPEEKARGITIDLGFAHLELSGKIGQEAAAFHLGIIDVPGHEDFVKNMVAGVGSIDVALLIVAADDGWMPQTEEHLQILTYLGVTRGIVALTKIDLAENEETVRDELRARLADSPFADAPIISTSVVSGHGIAGLRDALAQVLESTPAPRDSRKPRLPVDRAFTLRGIGTVVTGTLTGGTFHRGENVIVQPSGIAARIRSLQNHNREVEASGPGTRSALNLPDAKSPAGEKGIQRGAVVTLSELGDPTKAADVALEKSRRLINSKSPAARALKDATRVRVHLGSGNVAAHVILRGERAIAPGVKAIAQLRFEEPVFAFAGDRFIVRDWSEQATLAGGIILDPDAPRERGELRLRQLEACAAAPNDPSRFILAAVQLHRAIPSSSLLIKSRFSREEIANAVSDLAGERRLLVAQDWVIDVSWWNRLCENAAAKIDADHRAHPDRAGLPKAELQKAFEKELPSPGLFEPLLRELTRKGFAESGIILKRATHQLRLPPHLQAAGDKVRRALSAKPFDPPSRKDLAPDLPSQQALRFLIETGEAIDLGENVILLAGSFQRAVESIRRLLQAHGRATASEIRQALQTSRRVLIPLLEKLDKDRVTRREGDQRVLCG